MIEDRELARQSLEVIAAEAERLERLVGDVLDLAKLDAHRFTVLEEEVDMERLFEQVYSSFGEEARRRGIDYRQEVAARPVIVTDGDRVLQIVSNLLSNAFRWTPDGGRIELALAAENGTVSVSVRDTGPGIKAADRERIFRPFWSRDGAGTGLGLAIARELAVALGGRIELESSDGLGSRFTLRAARGRRPGRCLRPSIRGHGVDHLAVRRGNDRRDSATRGVARRAAAAAVDEEPAALRRGHLRRQARRSAAAARGGRRVRRLLRRVVGCVPRQRRARRGARPAPPDQAAPSGGERPARAADALVAAGALAVLALALAAALGPWSVLVLLAFVVLQVAYSVGLKHVVLIDVMAIAGLFVVRAVAGAVAVDVRISPWLLLCTGLLALFLALAKRRGELVLVGAARTPGRPVLEGYSLALVDQLVSIVAASTVIAYALYTFTARPGER